MDSPVIYRDQHGLFMLQLSYLDQLEKNSPGICKDLKSDWHILQLIVGSVD